MIRAFVLSELEMFEYETFKKIHEEKCDAPTSISFTFTDVGHIIHVECMSCGELEDITDVRNILERG